MQVIMSNHKSTKSALKNLEIQVGQLAKQLAGKSSKSFGKNTKKNPKEECKVVVTRSRKLVAAEDEDVVALKKQVSFKDTTVKKKNEVTDAMSQRGEKIMVKEKEIKDQEKEIEVEKEKKRKRKILKIKMKKRV